MARIRSRTYSKAGGTATWQGSAPLAPVSSSFTTQEYCSDVVGNRHGENPFYHYRFSGINWTCVGVTGPAPDFRWKYNGLVSSGNPNFLGNVTSPPADYAALQMARARTNPNRPITDLPVFIFELKDLPKLLKQAGDLILYGRDLLFSTRKALRTMPYRAADAYLGYEFGLAPLVRDLQHMVDFSTSVNKKLDVLNQLYSGGGAGYSKSATVWSEHVKGTAVNNYLSSLYAETNVFSMREHTEYKKWVSVKWKPTSPPPKTPQDRQALATRLAYGLDLSFSTIWEAMPWSWLVDWFTVVGDVLQNTRNTVPVTMVGSCVMTEIRTRWADARSVAGSGGYPNFAGSGAVSQRRVPGADISGSSLLKADLPFLDGKQLSILGALAVTRIGNR